MGNRRAELIRAEALRHRGLSQLDEARRLEHLEVAEALEYAASISEGGIHMQVGDYIEFSPSAFESEYETTSTGGRKKIGPLVTGRVAYIHPKGRYFVAEADVMGQKIRESFKLIPVACKGARK